jgi:hypothetical protein
MIKETSSGSGGLRFGNFDRLGSGLPLEPGLLPAESSSVALAFLPALRRNRTHPLYQQPTLLGLQADLDIPKS